MESCLGTLSPAQWIPQYLTNQLLFSERDQGHFQREECSEGSTSCLIVSLTRWGQKPASEKEVGIGDHEKEVISLKEGCIH